MSNLVVSLKTEIWGTDNMSCSLFGMFKTIARSDGQNGFREGVAILSMLTCDIHPEETKSDDFDFAAAAVI